MNPNEAIKILAPELKKKSLVPFCGAGISIPSGLPSAKSFMNENGFDRLPFPTAMSIAHFHPNFNKNFNKVFDNNNIKPNILHQLITRLNANIYITTNYDQLIEKSFKNSALNNNDELIIVRTASDIPKINQGKNILIKLHGDTEIRDLLILTKEDYIERIKTPNLVDEFVRIIFASNTILFIGYSLQDDNIFRILEGEKKLNSGALPDKYIVLPRRDEEFEKYLKHINVIPIYLDCQDDKITEQLSDFLFKLWCQYDFFEDLTNKTEIKSENSIEVSIQKALMYRNDNKPEEAKKILDKIIKESDWENNIEIIPRILWLYVGIFDSTEDWDSLETIQDSKLSIILNKLSKSLPIQISNLMKGVHESSLALLRYHSLNIIKAQRSYIKADQNIVIDDTSPSSIRILKANNLTIGAIIEYYNYIATNSDESLKKALTNLKNAESIFKPIESEREPFHHLGRFWGAKAFIHLNLVNETDIDNILDWARKAHSGPFRTENGKIAGRYCHAYCCYFLSKICEERKDELLRQAIKLLQENNIKINKNTQRIAAYKNSLLYNHVNYDLNKKTYFLRSDLKELSKNINEKFASNIKNSLSIKKWLKLPIN